MKKVEALQLHEASITKFESIASNPAIALQPRARGTVSLVCKQTSAGSVIKHLYQAGSARCLFPRKTDETLNAVFLNTSGGVTGGDEMAFSATAGADSTLTVTTQACERAYRAQPGQVGRVRNTLQVHDGARLNWMPQETILFEGSALDRRLDIALHDTASLLTVEPLVFGRAAMGEALHNCTLNDRIEIRRGTGPVYIDALRMGGDLAAHLAKAHTANGAGAMASVVLVDPSAEMHLDHVRALLPDTAGASLLARDILVIRLLATDSFTLRSALLPVLRALKNTEIPRCWMI